MRARCTLSQRLCNISNYTYVCPARIQFGANINWSPDLFSYSVQRAICEAIRPTADWRLVFCTIPQRRWCHSLRLSSPRRLLHCSFSSLNKTSPASFLFRSSATASFMFQNILRCPTLICSARNMYKSGLEMCSFKNLLNSNKSASYLYSTDVHHAQHYREGQGSLPRCR